MQIRRFVRACGVVLGVGGVGCGDDGGGGSGQSGSGTDATSLSPSSTGGGGSSDTGEATTVTPTTGGSQTGTTTNAAVTTTDSTGVVTTGGTDETSSGGGSSTTGGGGECGGCPEGFICKYEQCLPDLGPCTTNDDCPGDSYCDMDGQCIPYGVPDGVINDPDCQKENIPEGVTPTVQCEWKATDPLDKTKNSTWIYNTPMVADMNLDLDPEKLAPSIVVTTFYVTGQERIGMLRVFDGRTCTEQMRAGGLDEADLLNRPGYAVPWAIGDLDGDVLQGGHPELVGYQLNSNVAADPVRLYALHVDTSDVSPKLVRSWYGRDCANGDKILTFGQGTMTSGPELIDLDDDDTPEILVGEQVFGADGCLKTTWNAGTATTMNYVADVDLDGGMDLVTHNRVASWDKATTEWVDKPFFVKNAAQLGGHVAVANVGLYSAVLGMDLDQQPEVVMLSSPNNQGQLRIQGLDGKVWWGPVPLYKTGNPPENRGGPLTISDFDGDGQVEFASAGATQYAVYDPDCQKALMGMSPVERPGGTCDRAPEQAAKNLPDGVLWAQPSQDLSSNVTGSSIFDFNGDGTGEAVYRDECFIRVYDGKSGAVLFSAPGSSGTGQEYPTIADVDGDFATEIVVPRTPYAGCPAKDPLFPMGPMFTPAAGFVIYRDPMDRWANSRPVWNQHAYSVTHVTDDARIPKASEFVNNWQAPGLNNFRQNAQGGFGLLKIADLTVELIDLGQLCDFRGGTKELQAEVCNRGTNPVQDGVVVEFLETELPDQPVEQAMSVCTAMTSKLLLPGECEVVSCTAMLGGEGNIYVDVDPEDLVADCHPGNNLGAGAFELCPG